MDNFKVDFYQNLTSKNLLEFSETECETEIFEYLNSIYHSKNFNVVSEYSLKLNEIKNFEWLNTNQSLDIKNDLKNRLILIDFWTYCCINCMHIIPLLNQLENEFEDLVVIGIHSSKFENEKSKTNVLNAARRHLIKHPIVCDFDMKIWSSMEIICWPTLLVVDPNGLVIGEFQGEIQANLVRLFIKNCFKFYENSIERSKKLDYSSSNNFKHKHSSDLESLNFPTKICYAEPNLLFISDSGNNRIICANTDNCDIVYTIGDGQQGYENGSFKDARFDWPQGLTFDKDDNKLYICDTFNNLIRVADLNSKKVETLCGNKMNNIIGDYDYKGGKKGNEQTISSPWDLCLFHKDNSKILLIACAGTHQIWLYSFENKKTNIKIDDRTGLIWWKNLKIDWDCLICVAGNGKERNKNNSYPLQASFAQPSGMCIDSANQILYLADAESSSIRYISLKDGSVKGLCGGDNLQPDNLFAYGDFETMTSLAEAKFQHPLDVKYDLDRNLLFIADSYNNSIKLIDLNNKIVKKIFVKNLNEPNSIVINSEKGLIWIADTNNHCIKVLRDFDFNTLEAKMDILKINFSNQIDFIDSRIDMLNIKNTINDSSQVPLLVYFDFKLNLNATNRWTLKITNINNNKIKYEGVLSNENNLNLDNKLEHFYYRLGDTISIDRDLSIIESIKLEVNFVYCEKEKNGGESCKLLKKKYKFDRKQLKNFMIQDKNSQFFNSFLICLVK